VPNDQPIRTRPAAQVVESPARRHASTADLRRGDLPASGDLTKHLVMPALDNLSRTKVLPKKFALVGVDLAEGHRRELARPSIIHDMLKSFVGNAAAEFDIDQIDGAAWKPLAAKMSYIHGDLTKLELYEEIRGTLGEAEKTHGRSTPSSISQSSIGFSAPWWSSSARRSCVDFERMPSISRRTSACRFLNFSATSRLLTSGMPPSTRCLITNRAPGIGKGAP
jgi:Glucose-6-phosphate dehydrogenase, NAD binding domain